MTPFSASVAFVLLLGFIQVPPSKRPDLAKKWPGVDLAALEKRVAVVDERIAVIRKERQKTGIVACDGAMWQVVPTGGANAKEAAELLSVLFRKNPSFRAKSLRDSNAVWILADVLSTAEASEILKLLK